MLSPTLLCILSTYKVRVPVGLGLSAEQALSCSRGLSREHPACILQARQCTIGSTSAEKALMIALSGWGRDRTNAQHENLLPKFSRLRKQITCPMGTPAWLQESTPARLRARALCPQSKVQQGDQCQEDTGTLTGLETKHTKESLAEKQQLLTGDQDVGKSKVNTWPLCLVVHLFLVFI